MVLARVSRTYFLFSSLVNDIYIDMCMCVFVLFLKYIFSAVPPRPPAVQGDLAVMGELGFPVPLANAMVSLSHAQPKTKKEEGAMMRFVA